MSFEHCAVVHLFQPGLNPAARLLHDGVPARFHPCHVDTHFAANVHSKLRPAPREVRGVGAGDHRFCRCAAGVDARAAEQFPLYDGDLPAALSEPSREKQSSLTGTNDEVVEMFHANRETMRSEQPIATASSRSAMGRSSPTT